MDEFDELRFVAIGVRQQPRHTGNDDDENSERNQQEFAHAAQYTGTAQGNCRSDFGLSGSGEFAQLTANRRRDQAFCAFGAGVCASLTRRAK